MKKNYFAPLAEVQMLKTEPIMESSGFNRDNDLNVDEDF